MITGMSSTSGSCFNALSTDQPYHNVEEDCFRLQLAGQGKSRLPVRCLTGPKAFAVQEPRHQRTLVRIVVDDQHKVAALITFVVHLVGFHTMEYRHGPISLVDGDTFPILLYNPDTRDEEARVASEL